MAINFPVTITSGNINILYLGHLVNIKETKTAGQSNLLMHSRKDHLLGSN